MKIFGLLWGYNLKGMCCLCMYKIEDTTNTMGTAKAHLLLKGCWFKYGKNLQASSIYTIVSCFFHVHKHSL